MTDELVYKFERHDVHARWHHLTNNDHIPLCSTGFNAYVAIPRDVHEFEAVFTKEPPEHDHFLIQAGTKYGYSLETDNLIEFYEAASDLLGQAYNQGYIYLSVRY